MESRHSSESWNLVAMPHGIRAQETADSLVCSGFSAKRGGEIPAFAGMTRLRGGLINRLQGRFALLCFHALKNYALSYTFGTLSKVWEGFSTGTFFQKVPLSRRRRFSAF